METLRIVVVIATLCAARVDSRKKASDYFTPICHRSDRDISGCFQKVIENLKPSLIKGIPELKIATLEPLMIPRMEFHDGNGNFHINQVLTNLSINGLSNFVVKNVTMDIENLKYDMTLWTPFMRFTSYYDMDGKILLVPMKGKGDLEMNFTDVTTTSHVQMHEVERNGEQYLELETLTWDIDAKYAHFQFNNLFNGDKLLGDATNRFLNENWKESFNAYGYIAEEAFGSLFKDMTSYVYKTFPSKELLPH